MKKTRNNIYHCLAVSPFYVKEIGGLTYVFSSELHLFKFLKRIHENRSMINDRIFRQYGVKVDFSILADIILYCKIETRGFLICDKKGVSYSCLDDLILDGLNLMVTD